MGEGLDASDERVRELASEILAREEYAAWRIDVDAWRRVIEWLQGWTEWLEGLRLDAPALYWLVVVGLLLLSLVLLAHVVWTVHRAVSAPVPEAARGAVRDRPGLLVLAEGFAREGRYLEAARHVELATLELLLESRVIELGRSEPNRVLRRRLREAPLPEAERRELLGLVDRLERRLFRDRVEDPELYAGWRTLHRRVAALPAPA